jgi:hypothetical protein
MNLISFPKKKLTISIFPSLDLTILDILKFLKPKRKKNDCLEAQNVLNRNKACLLPMSSFPKLKTLLPQLFLPNLYQKKSLKKLSPNHLLQLQVLQLLLNPLSVLLETVLQKNPILEGSSLKLRR